MTSMTAQLPNCFMGEARNCPRRSALYLECVCVVCVEVGDAEVLHEHEEEAEHAQLAHATRHQHAHHVTHAHAETNLQHNTEEQHTQVSATALSYTQTLCMRPGLVLGGHPMLMHRALPRLPWGKGFMYANVCVTCVHLGVVCGVGPEHSPHACTIQPSTHVGTQRTLHLHNTQQHTEKEMTEKGMRGAAHILFVTQQAVGS